MHELCNCSSNTVPRDESKDNSIITDIYRHTYYMLEGCDKDFTFITYPPNTFMEMQ